MASPAQIAASIANAAHSTGPVTSSGKETVSRNALTHGLTAKTLLINGENAADLEAVASAAYDRYIPQSNVERRHVDLIIGSEWRLARAWRIHDALIATAQQNTAGEDGTLFSNPVNQRAFNLLLRYIRAIERSLRDTLKDLLAIQKQRLEAGVDNTKPAPATAAMTPPSVPAEPAPQQPALTRAERRAIERAQRKAAIRAARGSSVDPSALFRNPLAA